MPMKEQGKGSRQSNDVRLGDSLVGLPCLQRRRAELTAGLRGREGKGIGGTECSVCGMDVHELVHPLHGTADQPVILRVQGRFPGWRPEEGLCEPCLERFKDLEG